MADGTVFQNYDLEGVYKQTQDDAVDPAARNFVVDFGQNNSQIAFNLDSAEFESILCEETFQRRPECPVRWINIWAPNTQSKVVKVLANRYGFSPRLKAILSSAPSRIKRSATDTETGFESKNKLSVKVEDVEQNGGAEHRHSISPIPSEGNHYSIASHLTNYQSFDIGEKFICVGANWMHPLSHATKKEGKNKEPNSKRLWSWLILCDDSTVISLHEDSRQANADLAYTKAVRAHTLTVLSQLSVKGFQTAGSMSMISVRQSLRDDNTQDLGSEGASLLFYYLFDDWHATFVLIVKTQERLEILSKQILDGLKDHKSSSVPPDIIIPELYAIGRQLRMNQHLYRGYKNLIDRVLEFRPTTFRGSFSGMLEQSTQRLDKRIEVALSACERFKRLGDHIQLLVLSSVNEAIGEKDALTSTYWSITAQRDSRATAKLNDSTTLLSKLGVLFLPVSLMTAYFSVQIDDLQGVYSAKTYWACFVIVIALSFLAMFVFGRWLLVLSIGVQKAFTKISNWCAYNVYPRRRQLLVEDEEVELKDI